jgi:hypothetical protein
MVLTTERKKRRYILLKWRLQDELIIELKEEEELNLKCIL